MRALARIRTLAAICALLSFLTANVLAGVPGRPIDRPEGPPDPTTEVGDPDTGSGLPALIRASAWQMLISHPNLRGVAWLIVQWAGPSRSSASRWR